MEKSDLRLMIPLSGLKLRSARERTTLSQEEFAAKAGTSARTISGIEQKRSKRVFAGTAMLISTALGVELDALRSDRGEPIVAPARDEPPTIQIDNPIPGSLLDAIEVWPPIPTYDLKVSASVWQPMTVAQLRTDDPVQRLIIQRGIFRLNLDGQCMEPAHMHGSTVEFEIVRLGDGSLLPGRDYIVCLEDGTGTFKRFVEKRGDYLVFVALNRVLVPDEIRVPHDLVSRVAIAIGEFKPYGPPIEHADQRSDDQTTSYDDSNSQIQDYE